MKNILSIAFFLVAFAAKGQIQEYVIEASDSLITRGVLQIDADKFKATTQVSSDDTTLVSLDYLTNLLDNAEYADSLAFHSGTGYLVYYRQGVALDSTSMDGRYLTAEVDGSITNELQNLSLGTTTTTTQPIGISSGTGVTLPAATTSAAGLLSATDKSKLDNIEANANNYNHPTGFTDQPASALTGASVISQIDVTSEGHVHGVSTRALSASDIGAEAAQTKGNLTESVTGLEFSATRQVIGGAADLSLSTGYEIPTTTSIGNWNTAYTNRITSLTTTGNSGAATLVSNVLNIPNYTLAGLGYSTPTLQQVTTAGNTTSNQIVSTVTTGTAPLSVASTTRVNNLNVQYLNGYQSNQFGGYVGGVTDIYAIGGQSLYTFFASSAYPANAPVPGVEWVQGIQFAFAENPLYRQVLASTSGNLWFGKQGGGAWANWEKLYTSGNFISGTHYQAPITNTLSSGYIPYWDGLKLSNSVAKSVNASNQLLINNGSSNSIRLQSTAENGAYNVELFQNYAPQGMNLNVGGYTIMKTTGYNQPTTLSLGVVYDENAINIDNIGRVGIGTTAPAAKLTVNGNAIVTAGYGGWEEGLNIDSPNGTWGGVKFRTVGRTGNIGNWHLGYNETHNTQENSNLYLYSGASVYVMAFNQTGNVGIGYNDPQQKLDVNGNIRVRSVGTNTTSTVLGLDSNGDLTTNVTITGGATWKGGWNASTNTPTLSDATGTNGWWYKVTVAGTQNLGSGSITFAVGDDVIHNGTVWQKFSSSVTETDPVFVASGAYGITSTDRTNWTTAYNDKINSAAFSGTTTKTLTLTQQDGGTVTASFTDDNTTYTAGTGIGASGTTLNLALEELTTGPPSLNTHWIPWVNSANNLHYRVGLLDLQGISGYNAGKLQNVPIASTTPTLNYIMRYNGSVWTPSPETLGSTLTSGNAINVVGDSINYKPTRVTTTMTDLNIKNNQASIYTNFEYNGAIYRTTLGQMADLSLYNAREVQGYFHAANTPDVGDVWKWDGTQYAPAPDNTGGMTDPMTTRGDIIYRNSSNVTARLGRGTAGQLLYSNGTDLSWRTPVKADIGLGNVENTALSTWTGSTNIGTVGSITQGNWGGDPISAVKGGTGKTSYTAYALLAGGTTSTGTLQQVSGVGTAGQVLTSNGEGALPSWQAAPSGGGMTNPMTTTGDLIYGGASGTPTRRAIGSEGQILSVSSGVPNWVNNSSGGWVDDGTTVRLGTSTDNVAIGASSAGTYKLYVNGNTSTTTLTVTNDIRLNVLSGYLSNSSIPRLSVVGSDHLVYQKSSGYRDYRYHLTPKIQYYMADSGIEYYSGQLLQDTLTANRIWSITEIPEGASGEIFVVQDEVGGRSLFIQFYPESSIGTELTKVTVGATTSIKTTANKHTLIRYRRWGTKVTLEYLQEP